MDDLRCLADSLSSCGPNCPVARILMALLHPALEGCSEHVLHEASMGAMGQICSYSLNNIGSKCCSEGYRTPSKQTLPTYGHS